MNNEITPLEIDLSSNRVDEYLTTMFATAVKTVLQGLFGAKIPPVKIKGNRADIKAFTDTIHKEKSYMETFQQHGLDNPQTYRSKAKLDSSVSKFERTTGLTWPFK